MRRALTIKNVLDKKFEGIPFTGLFADIFGDPEPNGAWLIWGDEKQGKTWLTIKLADELSCYYRVLYVSAEEGISKAFNATCNRVGLEPGNRNLSFAEYMSVDELDKRLQKKRAPAVVILDNMTIYSEEFKNGVLRQFLLTHSKKLFLFVAHEDRKEPYTATAKLVRRLAKVIIYVKGLQCTVSGRVPGGVLQINEDRAMLYSEIKN